MNLGPLVGDAGDGGRDLVFVSYSHEDAQWVQRFTVLLKPLVRRRRLRLWADTDIRVGDEWYLDIDRAIERSSVALLVVSADFLASDFIMEHELPALIAQGVRLAPVLAGACFWNQVPELAQVQWLHDPEREGALNLVADQPGQRDRRLREICERLIALAPLGRGDLGVAAPVVAYTPPVVAVHAGSGRAELSGVPALPPGYLARDELAAVIEAVVAVDGGAVGLTGAVPAVGLHGQGGIGKSVLAAAVAREEEIRRCFPDGVYWVTAGEKADVLAVQLELLARLGARDRAPSTLAEALGYLREVLADRRVLLVVDDVWSDAAAQAFRATGPPGRVLYTSRDPRVLIAVGARRYQVDVLSLAEAREVAAVILGVPAAALPAAADRALAEVGQVALAVALLAAAVLGGRSWDEVAAALQRDVEVFGDHPYANTFKAMQIAVAGLPAELADALSSLAVFPADAQIPLAAITRYWAHTRNRTADQTACDLDALTTANVLRLDDDSMGFHDLQHDYLLLHAPTLALLHAGLLDAYRVLLPDHDRDQWWRLPVGEPYVWDHLVAHLRGAGERRVLAATVTDPAYLVQRIAAGGPHAAEADLGRAAAALPTHDLIAWWRDWLARHAHLVTPSEGIDDKDRAAAVTPTMLAWLTADGSRPESVDPARLAPLLPDPHLRVRWGLTPPDTALVRVLTGHTGPVGAVAWSPDGTRLASAGPGGEVRVWDPATGQQLSTLTGHTHWVQAMAWSADGTRLASGGGDGKVLVWAPTTGEQLPALTGHTREVRAVAWSPDGSRLASASDDGKVLVWDPTTGEHSTNLTDHTGWVWAVAWSADGSRLASASDDGKVLVWDPTTGEQLATLTGHTRSVDAMAWSADGTRLASADYDGEVLVWDPTTGQQLSTLTGHRGWIWAVAWSADGSRLASAGDDGEVRVWDPATGQQLSTLTGHTDVVRAVAWSADSNWLASAGDDGEVRVWDPTTDQQLANLTGHINWVWAVAWSADGSRLASAGYDKEVRIWDPATGQQLSTLTGHIRGVRAVAWSPDGTRLASASDDRKVRVWDPTTSQRRATLTGHTDVVVAVAWSPDGTRLASAGEVGEVRVWDPTTAEQLSTLTAHTRGVWAVTWSADGSRLASAGDDGEVRVWDPTTAEQLSTLTGHTGGVRAVSWSADGTRLASAGSGGEVRVWDPTTGQQLDTLIGHTDVVRAVAWSADGTRLASASYDGKINIFELGRPDHTIYLRVEPLTCLQWSIAGIAIGGPHGVGVLDLTYT